MPTGWTERWVAGFARGLAADQRRYGIVLCGGDTVVTPGPLTITITAFGRVPRGAGLARAGARAGDELWVSGTIGDGALGLLAARGRLDERRPSRSAIGAAAAHDAGSAPDRHRDRRQPMSPMACWPTPAISPRPRGLPCMIERERVPLSAAARRALAVAIRRCGPTCWAAATTTNS